MVIVYNMSQHIEIIYKKAQQKRETEKNSGKRKNERLKLKERKEAGLRLTCVDVLLLVETKSRHSPRVTDATKITSVVTIHTSRLSSTLPIKPIQRQTATLLLSEQVNSPVLFNTNPYRDLSRVPDEFCFGVNVSHAGILQGVCWCSWRERRANLLPPPSTQKTPNLPPSTMTRLISVYTLQKVKKNR